MQGTCQRSYKLLKKKKINIICYQNYYEGVYERCTNGERMRDVSTNTHTRRDKQTHTQHTHTNLSPMAGTVPNQGPGTG